MAQPELFNRLASALADRYRLERELGAGGMATVYLAHDLRHDRQVAIKVLREDLTASLGADRFLREIKIAARLQHPHIVPLIDSGNAAGQLFFVMPYLSGQSLRERLTREGELPIPEATRILTEVVDALVEAHAHNVVHRDIKPDNVMLSGRHALVSDFGVAKAITEATGTSTLTTRGVTVGTPAYMSPEQAAADPHVDHRADIYAVGVLGYELLTGRPPFVGGTAQQVLASHVTEEPDNITKRRPAIPAALSQVIMRCLAKRPADRFQTAGELLSALDAVNTLVTGVTPNAVTPVSAVALVTKARRVRLVAIGALLGAVATFLLLRDTREHFFVGRDQPFTSEPALELQPSIAPGGDVVVYAAGTIGHLGLWVKARDGGRPDSLLNDNSGNPHAPSVSHDGKRVLFLRGNAVFVTPIHRGDPEPLVERGKSEVVSATWGPDDKEIAFVRHDTLYIRNLATHADRIVATHAELHSCQWAPRRGLIACVVGNPEYVAVTYHFANRAPSAIAVVPATGGHFVLVTDSTHTNQSPQWLPGGKQLLFISNALGVADVYSLAVTASGARGIPEKISSGWGAHSISLSSDGRQVAYAKFAEITNIWSLPVPPIGAAPSGHAQLEQVTFGSQVVDGVAVSRDGNWLVYDSDLDGFENIYRLAIANGAKPEQLTRDTVDNFSPTLSPDSKEVVFHSFQTGARDVFVLSLTSGVRVQLVMGKGVRRQGQWSPSQDVISLLQDGKLYIVRRDAARRWGPLQLIAGGWGGGAHWLPDGSGFIFNTPGVATFDTLTRKVSEVYDTAQAGKYGRAGLPRVNPLNPKVIFFKLADLGRPVAFFSLTRDGGPAPTPVAGLSESDLRSVHSDWDSDGRHFYFTLSERRSDLHIAELVRR